MIDPTPIDIGRAVVYVNVPPGVLLERGVITSFNDDWVFVRYGSTPGSRATARAALDWADRAPVAGQRDRVLVNYHDLYVTTSNIPRTSIGNLPYRFAVVCTRVGAWELWDGLDLNGRLIAGEFHNAGLRLDVNGVVIVDSLTRKES